MAYQTPNVVKEIFIPLSYDDNGTTLDEYKAKYGIDLKEFFSWGNGEFTFDTKNAKLSIVFENYVIVPMLIDADDYGTGYALSYHIADEEGTVSIEWGTMVTLIEDDGVLKISIIDK